MIHYVRIVDPEQSEAVGRLAACVILAWLAWHYLPDAWAFADVWLGHVWMSATGALDSVGGFFATGLAFARDVVRLLATVQAVLLPLSAIVAGFALGAGNCQLGLLLWPAMSGAYAALLLLLGQPMFAIAVLSGSLMMLWAVAAATALHRGVVGWLAGLVAVALSAWAFSRFGSGLDVGCWPVVSASWCCLALGAAFALWRQFGKWFEVREPTGLILLAAALAIIASGHYAMEAVHAAGLLPGTATTALVQPAPAAAHPSPRETGAAASPVAGPQLRSSEPLRGNDQGGKPTRTTHPAHQRT